MPDHDRQQERGGRNRILVIGADLVMPKLFYYSGLLAERGMRYVVYTHDATPTARAYAGHAGAELIAGPPHARKVSRVIVDIARLWRSIDGRDFHHADLFSDYHVVASLLYFMVLKAKRIPVVMWCRGELFDWEHFRWWERAYFRLAMRWADTVILKEKYMQPLLKREGMYDPDKMIELHNSVPMPPARPAAAFGPGPVRLLFMNTFKHWRNVTFFAELARELRERGLDFEFRIVGEKHSSPGLTEEAARLKAALDRYELNERVTVHPFTTEPAEYQLGADIFLISGDVIYCNYALLEAMARELVPITENVDPDTNLIFDDGVSGFALPLEIGPWADTIMELAQDRERARAIGRAARARITEHFSTEAVFERYARAVGLSGVAA